MRLHVVTVRNYRLHRECRVEFDDRRTLIGGPNESGKSTLVEAVHRAFFLSAKGNTEAHRAMASSLHDGKPEVEVEFTARGARHTLLKQFRGASGSTRLTRHGGPTWSNDEAETQLAELTGTPHARASKIHEAWAHLWIVQGRSGDNPLDPAQGERDRLLRHLQDEGGAAIAQSETDHRLAAHFAELVEQTFTQNGVPRAHSDLGRARQALDDAETAAAQAAASLAILERALAEHQQSGVQLAEAEAALRSLQREQRTLETRMLAVAALQREVDAAQRAVTDASREQQRLADAGKRLNEAQAELDHRRASLAPEREKLHAARQSLQSLRDSASAAEQTLQLSREALLLARARLDLANARQQTAEREQHYSELAERAGGVQRAQERKSSLHEELAALPILDAAAVEALQAAEQAVARAEASLAGMAAGLEVLASDQPVQLGAEILAPGETRVVTASVEIRIGDGTRLRLHPGGGTGLEDARRERAQAALRLQSQLSHCAVRSVAEARTVLRRRETLQADLRMIDQELRVLGADKLDAALAQARQVLATAQAEGERRAQVLASLGATAIDSGDAREAVDLAEGDEAAARAAQEAAQLRWREAEQQTQALDEALRLAETEVADLESRRRLLQEELGNETARAQALAAAEQARRTAEAGLQDRRAALAQLAPADLETDRERLERSLSQQQQKRDDALRRQADSAGRLRADGGSDPVAALKTAQARLDAARARHDGLSRRTAAQRRIHDLFTGERQALSNQLTRPLAERVEGYLQRLFGPEASLNLRLEDGAFTGLGLGRGALGATPFDQLSGGAREQVAAAFRLAMAEILAQSHEGCLPVVFDDAFAHSDPERVQKLLRLLDLAASRGLQVIVLTCTPADYAGLGATEVRFG